MFPLRELNCLCHVPLATYSYNVFRSPSPASHSTSVQQVSHKTMHCRTIVSRRIWKPVGSQDLYDLLTTVCDSLTPTVLSLLTPQVSFPEPIYPIAVASVRTAGCYLVINIGSRFEVSKQNGHLILVTLRMTVHSIRSICSLSWDNAFILFPPSFTPNSHLSLWEDSIRIQRIFDLLR